MRWNRTSQMFWKVHILILFIYLLNVHNDSDKCRKIPKDHRGQNGNGNKERRERGRERETRKPLLARTEIHNNPSIDPALKTYPPPSPSSTPANLSQPAVHEFRAASFSPSPSSSPPQIRETVQQVQPRNGKTTGAKNLILILRQRDRNIFKTVSRTINIRAHNTLL